MADKKVLVLGGLAVVLLGVGVMQFVAGGPDNEPRPDPAPRKRAEKKPPEPLAENVEPTVAAGPIRDPFEKPRDVAARAIEQGGPGRLPDGTRFRPPEPEKLTDAIPQQKTVLPPIGGDLGAPLPVEPALNRCGYEAVGVVIGPVPVAVLRDTSGQELLVKEGQKADGMTRVVKVTPRSVTVRTPKGTVTLAIGGGVVENKK